MSVPRMVRLSEQQGKGVREPDQKVVKGPVMSLPRPERCPWSGKQLRKLGKRIREGEDLLDHSPDYEEVMAWYDDIAAFVVTFLMQCDWQSLLGARRPQIVSRVKTIDTLREKLQRQPSFPLHQIQDIAGVRFEAEMSLDEQDAVVTAIEGYFNDMGWSAQVKDYRTAGGHSGYRAVHVWLQLEPIGRVEVQVRTHLQGKWANNYEFLADRIGREIRYDVLPEQPILKALVEGMHETSLEVVAELEQLRVDIERLQLVQEFPEEADDVDTLQARMRRTENGLMAYFEDLEEKLRAIDWEAVPRT